MTISVIIPVFNEANTILQVLESVLSRVEGLTEIIIIDDCSIDETGTLCKEFSSHTPMVMYHPLPVNMGKTRALVEGFARSTGEVVIVQDADLEYDPAEINAVVQPILQNQADVVLGSRFLTPGAFQAFRPSFYIANRLITAISNFFTGLHLTDVETCYKGFRGEVIRKIKINSERFGFEVEVMAKVSRLGLKVKEVPISYNGRSYQEGKKIGIKDGVMALYYIFRYAIPGN